MTHTFNLEAIARAAGVRLNFIQGVARNTTGFHPEMNVFAAPIWNPATNPGDCWIACAEASVSVRYDDEAEAVIAKHDYEFKAIIHVTDYADHPTKSAAAMHAACRVLEMIGLAMMEGGK